MAELAGERRTHTPGGGLRSPHDASNLADVIQAYMQTHGIATHGEMAAILGVDRTLVSKYVSGARNCHDVTQLRRFAEAMDVSPETFGLLQEPDPAYAAEGPAGGVVNEWRLIRQTMNRNRSQLTKVVADLYWDPVRIERTTCVTLPEWMPRAPVDLDAIELTWQDDARPPEITGVEPEAAPYRAAGPDGQPYHFRRCRRGSLTGGAGGLEPAVRRSAAATALPATRERRPGDGRPPCG